MARGTGRVLGVLGALLAMGGLSAARAEPAPTALRVAQPNAAHFPEITLYALPSARDGHVVGGLEGAFSVAENGSPARILRVESQAGTLDLCLALDRSQSMLQEQKILYARLAAQTFLHQLQPSDRAALVSFADGASLDHPLSGNRTSLSAAIARAEAMGETTCLFDGIYWAIGQVSLSGGGVVTAARARPEARRVVIAVTDGQDLSSRVHPSQLVRLARAHGVSLCTVALGKDAETGILERLARETGGVCLYAPSPRDLEGLYSRLAGELRREYRIVYASPNPQADGSRREVRLTLPGEKPTAKTWYQAPGAGSLLVTLRSSAAPTAPVTATRGGAPVAASARDALIAVLVLGFGLGLLFVWLGLRGQVRTPRPALRPDLPPLWVRPGSVRVGRTVEADLVLESRQASQNHARIETEGAASWIRDEGSAQGTFVNGRRIRGRSRLRFGDVVRFADQEFQFHGMYPDSSG